MPACLFYIKVYVIVVFHMVVVQHFVMLILISAIWINVLSDWTSQIQLLISTSFSPRNICILGQCGFSPLKYNHKCHFTIHTDLQQKSMVYPTGSISSETWVSELNQHGKAHIALSTPLPYQWICFLKAPFAGLSFHFLAPLGKETSLCFHFSNILLPQASIPPS